MPELKRGFGAAKMNKDADERTIPKGEYREALNIQITTSDESDVGTLQTLLGNSKINFNPITTLQLSESAKCVGVIADEQKNRIFYYVKDDVNFTDYIFKYDLQSNQVLPLVVDKYRVTVNTSSLTTGPSGTVRTFKISDLGSTTENITNVRPGMKIIQASFDNGSVNISSANNIRVIQMERVANTSEFEVLLDDFSNSASLFNTVSNTSGQIILEAPKALNLPDRLITGINVLDDTLFWTDGESEPKYLDVTCVKTNANGTIHSKYLVKDKDDNIITDAQPNRIDFRENPDYIKEEHLTVIKKSPLYPPTLLMSNTSNFRFSPGGLSELKSSITDVFVDNNDNSLEIGTIKDIEFGSPTPDYEVGDILLLRRTPDFEGDEDLSNFEIQAELLGFNSSASPNPTGKIKITFIKDLLGHVFGTSEVFHTMLKQEKPLYEFKFPRFAFRYKYQNSQYSPISPFSEPAFIPGVFNYKPKDGFNIGMVNNLRSLYVMDFVPDSDTLPKDVVAVDILYKESNTNVIYIVQTIEYEDEEWDARGSDINTKADNFARTKGALLITSEMLKSAIESNQILRPWDNVPRTAKSQELVGNRLVYANYKQNYNLRDI